MFSRVDLDKIILHCHSQCTEPTVTPQTQDIYSKVALLETCGWIELAMDDLARQCIEGRLSDRENIKYYKYVISKTYSFDYDAFRKLISSAIGIIAFDLVMTDIQRDFTGQSIHTKFVSSLNTLKTMRDVLAHTHMAGATKRAFAPSITKTHLDNVFYGLRSYSRFIFRHIPH